MIKHETRCAVAGGAVCLLVALASATIAAQFQSADATAGLMVDAAHNLIGVSQPGWEKMSDAQHNAAEAEWAAALEPILGEKPDKLAVFQLVIKTREFFPGGTFSPPTSSQFAGRVRSMSKTMLTAWDGSARRYGEVSTLSLIWYLVRQSAMFDGSSLRPPVADRQLKRFQSLPAAAVKQWAKSSGVDACGFSETCAAFALIQVEPLFVDVAFQAGRFEAALPKAELLAQARTKRQD